METSDVVSIVATAVSASALAASIYSAVLGRKAAEASVRSALAAEASANSSLRSADATEDSVLVARATYKSANIPRYEASLWAENLDSNPRWSIQIRVIEGPPDLWFKLDFNVIYRRSSGISQEFDKSDYIHLQRGSGGLQTGRRSAEHEAVEPADGVILVLKVTSVVSRESPNHLPELEMEQLDPWVQTATLNYPPDRLNVNTTYI